MRILIAFFTIVGIAVYGIVLQFTDNADAIIGKWCGPDKKIHVQIFKAGNGSFKGKYYGKIVWLENPTENGQAKTDKKNPDKNKRHKPLMGLIIMNDFVYKSKNDEWADGSIYDPKNGITYRAYLKIEDGELIVRGYIGMSVIGKTSAWTKVE